MAVNGTRGGPEALIQQITNIGIGKISLTIKKTGQVITASFVCSENQTLGLQVDSDGPNGENLRISGVKGGAVAEWNASNPPAKAMRVGDVIVAVNGNRGEPKLLLEETQRKGQMQITFVKG